MSQTEYFQQLYPWLTMDYFRQVLATDVTAHECVRLDSLKLEAGIGDDNAFTDIIRCTVKYYLNEDQGIGIENGKLTKLFIAKCGRKRHYAYLIQTKAFIKEIYAFERIFVEVNRILRKIGDSCIIGPTMFAFDLDKSFLLLNDLCELGYVMPKRTQLANLTFLKLAITKLAKWHAATATLLTSDPSLFDELQQPRIRNGALDINVALNAFKTTLNLIENWPGFEEIHKKLSEKSPNIIDKILQAGSIDRNGFNVLLHGDLNTNNLMYKNDIDGNVEDVMLIDFQCVCVGSPVLDIGNIFFTSLLDDDIKADDLEQLFTHYYMELKNCLNQLKYPNEIPPFFELKGEMCRRAIYSIPTGFQTIVYRFLSYNIEYSYETYAGDYETYKVYRDRYYRNKSVERPIKFLLKYCERNGYLN